MALRQGLRGCAGLRENAGLLAAAADAWAVRTRAMNDKPGGRGVVPEPDTQTETLRQTPWVRKVVSGVELIRSPKYNKGMAFSDDERDQLHLRGLIPPAVLSQELQVERVMINIRSMENDLHKYTYMTSLQERNERLFYRVLVDHIDELAPIVHVPTVGQACQKYGIMFRGLQKGLWISIADKGRVGRILRNWPENVVDIIAISDGERVLGLGDLGVHGMGVCVSKLAMYTACGGIHPARCLPICIDVGTDNEELLASPFYVGYHHRRVRGEEYFEFIDELIYELKKRYGQNKFIQLEDFSHSNSIRVLSEYRGDTPVFDDDIQGNAVVALAALISSTQLTGKSLEDHVFLFAGGEEIGTHIADLICTEISKSSGKNVQKIREQMWFMDANGLVVRSRADNLQDHFIPYAHEFQECADMNVAIDKLKPSVLIGAPVGNAKSAKPAFTRSILQRMAGCNDKPVVLALSTPPECTADEAYAYTDGKVVYAGGGHRTNSTSIVLPNGKQYKPSSTTSAYVFPGLAMGQSYSGSTKIHSEMLLVAAHTLAKQVVEDDLQSGAVLPPFGNIRKISCKIAKMVSAKAYDLGYATKLPRSVDMYHEITQAMFQPKYTKYL